MKILKQILCTISILLFFPSLAFAYSDFSLVGATVKISVCGDNIVEGEEECEKGLNVVFECKDFGYLPDSITCDNSCAYDILNCKSIKPVVPVIDEDEEEQEEIEPTLPVILAEWDGNNDGILQLEEFSAFIVDWVTTWKSFVTLPSGNNEKDTVAKQCDVNSDKTCNVTDFSIILYYLNND